ncbi:MAG: hypothetical protein B6U65_04245 [Candidatus Wolframiiraptor sp. EX4484-121]|nr:MAG: hypothetical protein B6U65_04245 [Candidatus Wolframiiraptor sp. EX4484-121]
MKNSRRMRKSRRIYGRYVKVFARGSRRCALCGKPLRKDDDLVSIGLSRRAHLRCAVKYEFSVLGERR